MRNPQWLYYAMLALQSQMEEDKDPNSPRNQHQREMERKWAAKQQRAAKEHRRKK